MSDRTPGALSGRTLAVAIGLGALAAALVSTVIIGQKRSASNSAPRGVEIVDGGKQVGLDGGGHLTGVPPLPQEDAALLVQVLSDQRFPSTRKGVALPRDPKAFAALAPLGEKTSNLPTFTWRELDGAKSYRVTVEDSSGQTVAESEPVRGASWTVTRPLGTAQHYSWSLRAETASGLVAALPADKSFETMTNGDLATVQEARSHGLHLLTAAVFAKLGMWSEADRELDTLAAENADSSLLKGLKASVPVAH